MVSEGQRLVHKAANESDNRGGPKSDAGSENGEPQMPTRIGIAGEKAERRKAESQNSREWHNNIDELGLDCR